MDRLKELEAPAREPVASREPSGVPESVVEEPERAEEESRSGTGGPQEGAEKKSFTEEEPESRSWWRRVFGA